MRLIDVDALEKAIYEWMPKDQETWMDSEIPPIENLVVSIMMTIQEQPTVEAIPVRYTYLRRSRIYPGAYECSECGVSYPQYVKNNGLILNYCSKCGAKFMRGDETRREE